MGVILGSRAEVESTFVFSAWIVIERNLTMRNGPPFNPTRSPRKKGEWKSFKKMMTATTIIRGENKNKINPENRKSKARIMGSTHNRYLIPSPRKTVLYDQKQVDQEEARQVRSSHYDWAKSG
jgi:hypothetical protein